VQITSPLWKDFTTKRFTHLHQYLVTITEGKKKGI